MLDQNILIFVVMSLQTFVHSINVPDEVKSSLQMLEVIRLEGHSLAQEDAFVSRDIHLLQVMPLTLVKSLSIIPMHE